MTNQECWNKNFIVTIEHQKHPPPSKEKKEEVLMKEIRWTIDVKFIISIALEMVSLNRTGGASCDPWSNVYEIAMKFHMMHIDESFSWINISTQPFGLWLLGKSNINSLVLIGIGTNIENPILQIIRDYVCVVLREWR